MNPNFKSLRTIALLDSGVGGLSVLQAVATRLPHCRYVYCADNANFPYGTKQDPEVLALVLAHAHQLIARYNPDVLIIACNTASTIALPTLRSTLSIPVVGVVPAIKPAAALSQSKLIGLLATEATVIRPYIDDLVNEFAANCRVLRVGSRKLVDIAERKLRGKTYSREDIQKEILPFFEAASEPSLVDVIVLGCTHFPLLKEELMQASPWEVQWIDSGDAIAKRVAALLDLPDTKTQHTHIHPESVLVFTKQSPSNAELLPTLAKFHLAGCDSLYS